MSIMPLRIFLMSSSVGAAQIFLSYAAGVHFNSAAQAVHWLGYIECYNWSVTYLIVAPAILAACIPNTIVLYRRSTRRPAYRKRFLILLALALAYATATAGREAWQALSEMHGDGYFEWSHLSAGEWSGRELSALQNLAWRALFVLSYAHYFVAGFFGFAGAFGTLWYFYVVSRDSAPRKLSHDEEGMLFNQKVAVFAYLLFLVLLRSAKVSMSMNAKGAATDTFKIFDFISHTDAYLSSISPGLLLDLIFGAFWLLVTLVSHGLAHQLHSPQSARPGESQSLKHLFERAAHAYAYFGRGARFWAGVLLFGIVVPAPGFATLVSEAAFFAAIQLVKSGLSRSRESAE